MVRQEDVLRLIHKRTVKEGRSTSYRSLVKEFGLPEGAACDHLKRAWRERLILSTMRPPRYKYRLEPGESIRDLRFRISSRGKERIRWYDQRDEEEGWVS